MTAEDAIHSGRFAALSDIHGNLPALEAVLADAAARGIHHFVALGDHLQGPLDPIASAERLIPLGIPSIRGNCDRLLLEDSAASDTTTANRAALSDRHKAWLAAMPPMIQIDDVLLCHGTPFADDVYLLEEVTVAGARQKTPDAVAAVLSALDHTSALVLCGHSHLPRAVRLPDGALVVNPGSVGLPAYSDEEPHPHAMAAGTPYARYAILTRSAAGWQPEQRAIPYDWDAAAALALRHHRPDWAAWLRTGRT